MCEPQGWDGGGDLGPDSPCALWAIGRACSTLSPPWCGHGPREMAHTLGGFALRNTHLAMAEDSTTPDLVELTRRMFDAANRRDLDVTQKFFAPDAFWETVSLGTSFEGAAAIRDFLED